MNADNLDRFVAEFKGWEHVQAAINSRAGAVFATLHMGSWELAGAYLSWRGVPLTVVALPHCDPRINRLFLDRREGTGMEVVPVGGAMRKLGDALTRGRFIALIADRDTSGRGLRMPFFGQPARMPTGHAFLALNTGAWILPGCVYRLPDGRNAIEIRSPLIPNPNSDTVESLSLRCLGILEEFVRTRPEQWAAFYDLWSDSPKQAT
jgi:KDO2-lipid IV(A) lauroyltransferase